MYIYKREMTYSCASSSPNQYGLAKTSTITLVSMFTSTVAKLQLKGHLKGPKALLKNPHNPSPSFIP